MSKYEELCTSLIEYQRKYTVYREETWRFAGRLVDGLIEYLGCPRDRVQVFPPNEKPGATLYTIPGALQRDGNGYWSMVVSVSITDPHRTYILIPLSLNKDRESFVVRLKNGHHATIAPDSAEGFESYHRMLFEDIKRLLDSDPGRDRKSTALDRIGFEVSVEPTPADSGCGAI